MEQQQQQQQLQLRTHVYIIHYVVDFDTYHVWQRLENIICDLGKLYG